MHTEGLTWREWRLRYRSATRCIQPTYGGCFGSLEIYISRGCRGRKRTLELVSWVLKAKPSLKIDVVDVSTTDRPDQESVFAFPAHVYRSRAVFLGNPSQQELERWLDTL